ncbi:hypothetical protein ACFL43_01745 [Thermodesulfobacteriota bacterium]
MGNLVDVFILSSRYEWMSRVNRPSEHNLQQMLRAVPEQYRMMLRALMVRYESLDRVMDNRDSTHFADVKRTAEQFETDMIRFSDRYRNDCLQQVIRRTFYDTLLIVENDYNPYKYNCFFVLQSNLVISQAHWAACPSEEQAFVGKVVGSLQQSGYNVHRLHG